MAPCVSIGLPVFNGENYLQEAVNSIFAQSFRDFELIISDNGSTDRTEKIGSAAAKSDPRVRFVRSQTNRGAAWNFNRVLELARGKFFKWAAHDDVLAPDFLTRCVALLHDDPSASLAFTRVRLIDEQGQVRGDYRMSEGLDLPAPHRRFQKLLMNRMCFEIFGLMPTNVLRRTPGMGNYPHADGVLLAELSLFGPIRQIDEPLFCSRRHAEQSDSVMKNRQMWAVWFDPANRNRRILPIWTLYGQYFRAVRNAPVDLWQRGRCCGHLLREMLSDSPRLARELLLSPRSASGNRRSSATRA